MGNIQQCNSKDFGTYELSGGVTATLDELKFVIRGAPVEGQRGEVRGYKKKQSKTKIPTGLFWNLYGLLPKSHALAAVGLCKSQDTCEDMYTENPRIAKAKSMFQVGTLAQLSKTCSGNCAEGLVPPDCKKMKSQCELEACDDPEKLKACSCKENGATVADAKKTCAASACGEDVVACELDYCMSGGDAEVAVTYKGMQANVCEVACEQCRGTGGTCSSCADSPSCNPTCTHPAPTPPTPGGCATCDLVPCGYCQEGCPMSTCTYKSSVDKPKKTDRNGCMAENKQWPPFKPTVDPGTLNIGQVPRDCRPSPESATPAPAPHQEPASPYCTHSVANDNVCCDIKCGTCETDGCSSRLGGKKKCCPSEIRKSNTLCTDTEDDAPCIIPQIASAPPSAMPTLSKGMAPAPTSMPTLSKGTTLTQTRARKRLVLEHGKSRGQADPLKDGESWL